MWVVISLLTGESAPPISGCELIFGEEQKRLLAQHLMHTSGSFFFVVARSTLLNLGTAYAMPSFFSPRCHHSNGALAITVLAFERREYFNSAMPLYILKEKWISLAMGSVRCTRPFCWYMCVLNGSDAGYSGVVIYLFRRYHCSFWLS